MLVCVMPQIILVSGFAFWFKNNFREIEFFDSRKMQHVHVDVQTTSGIGSPRLQIVASHFSADTRKRFRFRCDQPRRNQVIKLKNYQASFNNATAPALIAVHHS